MHLCLGTSLTTKSDALSCTLALSLRTSWSLEGFCCHVWDNSLNISRGYMGLFHSLQKMFPPSWTSSNHHTLLLPLDVRVSLERQLWQMGRQKGLVGVAFPGTGCTSKVQRRTRCSLQDLPGAARWVSYPRGRLCPRWASWSGCSQKILWHLSASVLYLSAVKHCGDWLIHQVLDLLKGQI